jgi:hypothetical protein
MMDIWMYDTNIPMVVNSYASVSIMLNSANLKSCGAESPS